MTTVEQGRARCPRCATWAEYRFLEIGDAKLKYEVRCGTCGHVHAEVTAVSTAGATAA
ncbi:MAG: hypothetical protein QOE30_355 [Mycobacterium sp.]|uniref:hypothetical protein n=1 Tax=Mycobacterium sp. TaxID=1785 RepID=UPI0028B32C9F|nr:hypothetical protein [Mycobacterium sp.]MDT5114616.1 hypothetical protein [Mycobacterium sp.]MDT5251756.1 hypothetical protein [Mycobacterium sp.]